MEGIFLIHHMKRSGGHAVINWLKQNAQRAIFINNAIPIQKILEGRRANSGTLPPYENWLRQKQRDPQLAAAIAKAATVLVSLEDHEIGVRPFDHPATRVVLVVRQPNNLFASRIRRASSTGLWAYSLDRPDLLRRTIRIWKGHARAALGLDNAGPLKTIFYDAWLIGKGYRARLARDFDFSMPHEPSGELTREGDGSSFGAKRVDPTDLLRREKFLSEPEKRVLTNIMADPEMTELADQMAAKVEQLLAPASPTTSKRG